MNFKWWEKTVEYKFIVLVAQEKKLFLAPLADRQERAGDAIFSTNNKWLLIEFKKDKGCISTEKAKFINYQTACNALSSRDKHHHIVYGQEHEERLKLYFQTYFSNLSIDRLSDLLTTGIELNFFKSYIKEFTAFKKLPADQGGGSGGLSVDEFAIVAGVNNDGEVVECMSLTDFIREHKLELTNEKNLTNEYKGPSFGR